MKKRIICCCVAALLINGCSGIFTSSDSMQTIESEVIVEPAEETKMFSFTKEDLDSSYTIDGANQIKLNEGSIFVSGKNMQVTDNKIMITEAGTYVVSGNISNGGIEVNAEQGGLVRILLDGASIVCKEGSPIYVEKGKTILTMKEGTVNYIEDGPSYVAVDEEGDPSAAIFSKDQLTINGTGTLEVKAHYKNAIQSKQVLKIVTGTYNITAAENGFVGNGGVMLRNGSYNIVSTSKNDISEFVDE